MLGAARLRVLGCVGEEMHGHPESPVPAAAGLLVSGGLWLTPSLPRRGNPPRRRLVLGGLAPASGAAPSRELGGHSHKGKPASLGLTAQPWEASS